MVPPAATEMALRATVAESPPPCLGIGLPIVPCELLESTHAAFFQNESGADSLNADPFNVHAETLAMQDCMAGIDVRRVWTEREMVRAIDGKLFPGTPDGMFEDWDGALICVQVVRVPLTAQLSIEEMHESLAQTIITKVVKSQHWLRAWHSNPSNFIIFCWLPFEIPETVAREAEELMAKVRESDARFTLRLRIPASPGSLFPALFACNYDAQSQRKRAYSWSDVATFPDTGLNDDDSDDFVCEWDITWYWDDDEPDATAPESDAIHSGVVPAEGDDSDGADFTGDWDVAWGPLELTSSVVTNAVSMSAAVSAAGDSSDLGDEQTLNLYPLIKDDGG
mmetsp:Transcript_68841/g.165248  ORF Transcript_68841/g.165248 Transcript_68841/m.165248 type:complete len:338 (-) Transcript_68841:179-1192(-)